LTNYYDSDIVGDFEVELENLVIDDAAAEPVPLGVRDGLEELFLERRPYGNSGSTYTLVPRASNEIRALLFQMALTDDHRKHTARSLLAQIEVWRMEHGPRPNTEPRHPFFDSGEPWPLLPPD
jgi:hypothetical protein